MANSKELNRRLTTLDASFLYCEKPTQPMHIGGCMTYAGHISRDEVIRILADRRGIILCEDGHRGATSPPISVRTRAWPCRLWR